MATEGEALQMAVGLHQRGQFAQAEQLYRRVLDANPWQPDALHLVGVVAHQTGRYELAVQYIGQAIIARPGQPIFHNNIGEAFRALGNFVEAQGQFERAISFDPNFSLPHNNLGKALSAQGKLEESVVEFRRAITCQPDLADAWSQLGAALVALSRFDEAGEPLETALRLAPRSVEARCALATALAAKGDATAATSVLDEVIRHDSGDARPLVAYGALLQAAGRAAEALPWFERALALEPDSAAAHAQRAAALDALQRCDEAESARSEVARIREQQVARCERDVLCINASHQHKCIFVHIPKNGGSSIKRALDMPAGGHLRWRDYATRHPQLWQQYATFAVIRNPWDRAISAYHQAIMQKSYWHNEQTGLHPDFHLLRNKSFDECVSILRHDRWRLVHPSWASQAPYAVDLESPDKPQMVGTLLRFETLAQDFAEFRTRLGIDCEPLATVNASTRAHDYRSYYNDQTRDMIAEVYRDDIQAFGYSF